MPLMLPHVRVSFGLPIASRKQAGLTTSASLSANWLFLALPEKCARSPFPSFDGRNCFMAGTSVAARHPTAACK
jgi:hypothetical protein